VRGLRLSTDTFNINILDSDFDIICLAETWLCPSILDSELFDDRFDVFRRDRTRPDSAWGGGVLIAVRRELHARACSWRSSKSSEEVWISIDLSKGKFLHIVCAYFPHNFHHFVLLTNFFEFVSDRYLIHPDDYFLVLGDFNISYADWTPLTCPLNYLHINHNNNQLAMQLSDFMSINNFKQFNNVLNSNNRILDLVLANFHCNVTASDHLLTRIDPHHPAIHLTFSFPLNLTSFNKSSILKRNFYKADYEKLNSYLNEQNWDILNELDTEAATKLFYDILYQSFEKFIPTSRFRSSYNKYPPWFTKEIKYIIRKKRNAHRIWKHRNNSFSYNVFKSLRLKLNSLIKINYNNYIKNCESKLNNNPKYFWSYIKSRSSLNSIPDYMTCGETTTNNLQTIVDSFNNYFSSVFVSQQPLDISTAIVPTAYNYNSSMNLSNVEISQDVVFNLLKNINTSTGPGSDNVHPLYISRCAHALSIPLTYLFRNSIKHSCFPQIWKKTLITPIHKSGPKNIITNYRPIAKLPCFGKIMEKIITDSLYSAFSSNFISPFQHGFMPGRSVNTNLLNFTNFVFDSIDKGFQVDSVYVDFSKAFDKLNHDLLLSKLRGVGIHGNLLCWINSYLKERCQAVSLSGFLSDFHTVSSGVPQGSHLGPFLFLLYINDIDSIFKYTDHLLYADDTKIFKSIHNPSDCLLFQSDIDRFINYCNSNQLFINLDKCNIITFSRLNHPIIFNYKIDPNTIIPRVSTIRDLGVILDSKLNFISHMDYMISKALKMLGFTLRISKPFKNPHSIIILFNCFIRNHLEFASVIWNPHYKSHIGRIESIQKKLLKVLTYRCNVGRLNYSSACVKFNLPPLEARRDYLDVLFIFKILNNFIDSISLLSCVHFRVPRGSSRSTVPFFIDFSRTNYIKYSYFRRVLHFYNLYLSHIDIFNCSLHSFKVDVKKALF
jgi:hypothetical protein